MGNRFFGSSIDMFRHRDGDQEVLPSGGQNQQPPDRADTPPGSGDSYTFTVRRDPAGATRPVSTGITCTVSDSATTCEDKVNSQTFAAGDAISVLATESSGPAGASMFFRLDLQP